MISALSSPSAGCRGTKEYLRQRSRRSKTRRIFALICTFLVFVFMLGLVDYIIADWGQLDIREGYTYPPEITNFAEYIDHLRSTNDTMEYTSEHFPVNLNRFMFSFHHTAVRYPDDTKPYGVLIVVKSAIENTEKRNSIRETWGNLEYLNDLKLFQRFPSRLVFLCGIPQDYTPKQNSDIVKDLFPHEWTHNDIVVADFVDHYDNNTYKSVGALRWATLEFPASYEYLLLVDDDMYIDIANLINYLHLLPERVFALQDNPIAGPDFPYYRPSTIYKSSNRSHVLVKGRRILGKGLYMGRLYGNAKPMRESFVIVRAMKKLWSVSIRDYPYNYFPPYVAGAAIVLSREAVSKFYYTSLFVKYFAIDDVYLGIISHKLGIPPVQNPHFYAWYPGRLSKVLTEDLLSEAIAIHGSRCPDQMTDLWLNKEPANLVECTS